MAYNELEQWVGVEKFLLNAFSPIYGIQEEVLYLLRAPTA